MIDKDVIHEIEKSLISDNIKYKRKYEIEHYIKKIKQKHYSGTQVFQIGFSLLYKLYALERSILSFFKLNQKNIYFSKIYIKIIKKFYIIYDV